MQTLKSVLYGQAILRNDAGPTLRQTMSDPLYADIMPNTHMTYSTRLTTVDFLFPFLAYTGIRVDPESIKILSKYGVGNKFTRI